MQAADRKSKLDESYGLQSFYADHRYLTNWASDMKARMQADELAQDVSGAENLLERHQEHKGEIDSRADSFTDTVERGKQLPDVSEDIQEKIDELEKEKQEVGEMWDEKLVLYKQCMDLQLFFRFGLYPSLSLSLSLSLYLPLSLPPSLSHDYHSH